MALRPLDLVPEGDGNEGNGREEQAAVEESLRVRLPAGLPPETLRAVEAAMQAVARAVMAGQVRTRETPGGDGIVMTFEVGTAEAARTVEALDAALARSASPRPAGEAPGRPGTDADTGTATDTGTAPSRAERRAAMVGRIRAANAETLDRLADL